VHAEGPPEEHCRGIGKASCKYAEDMEGETLLSEG
jgi:hypothetical protein